MGAYARIYPPERYPFPDAAVREVWMQALSDPEVEVYIAEVDGVSAGAVSVGKGFLSTLYVLPAYQGVGVGSALHDLALERLRAQGFEEARLWTLEGNDVGRRFYERRGWSLTDETRVVPYPPNPIDVQYALPLEQVPVKEAEAPHAADVERGQRIYSPLVLRAYDLFVLGFSNRFAWCCPSSTMLERYNRHLGRRHLDIGVGTGWYLDRAAWPVERPEITLLDLNENSLSAAARRLARYAPQEVRANVLEPLPLGEARFESAAANYLLHCLPGSIESKAATVAANVRAHLASGGVLFGATILGNGVAHTRLGRRLMRVYNAKGIFSNADDDERGLERGLGSSFADVQIDVVGAVALFTART